MIDTTEYGIILSSLNGPEKLNAIDAQTMELPEQAPCIATIRRRSRGY